MALAIEGKAAGRTTMTTSRPADNSRSSVEGAGWRCPARDLTTLLPPERRDKPPFRWSNLGTLLESRNDQLAKWFGDPSPDQRQLWLRQWYGETQPDLRIDRTGLSEPSFLVLGDTGEGDASQYALLALLESLGQDTDFMVICSDVIYPAGEVEEYEHKFFYPYRNYLAPIYGLPGNHDWYDDLRGFMFHFCGRDRQPQRPQPSLLSPRARLRERLWLRNPDPPDPARVARMRALRGRPEQQATLPGPYYVLQTGPVDLVAIDTGIVSGIDRVQGEWLRQMSRSSKPKVLLTGRPIYVDGKYRPCEIDGGRAGTVDEIVRDPACNYIAAIGGDIHNYQRYTVDVGGRAIQYIVSGGGGAFMHATHKIPNIDERNVKGLRESAFRCYPLRGDSLSFYSLLYERKFPGSWAIDPDQAAAYMSERLGIEATKVEAKDIEVSDDTRRRARRVYPLPGRGRGPWHTWFSEFFDWNQPPLFKSLLRIGASADRLTITCHAATGCAEDHLRQPEDVLVCDRRPDGSWRWRDSS